MSDHLLVISVGPVQSFIAAARKTRDLWFGSYLLSEISKAAARAVVQAVDHHQASERPILIFPAAAAADLQPGSELTVANVILAELPAGCGRVPQEVAEAAKKAAQRRWQEFAEEVFRSVRSAIREDIWQSQVDDVIEFYAAWCPLDGSAGNGYAAARRRAMRLLAGRKSCRDFLPARGVSGVPKSSLDGARESVLSENPTQDLRRRLRLGEGEHLDVVGMVKRHGGGKQQYPSVSRLAADPWLQGLEKEAPKKLSDLSRVCKELRKRNIVTEINPDRFPKYKAFRFEGTILYRSRHPDIRQETGATREDFSEVQQKLKELYKQFGEPSPYLAILVADGDRMGAAISRLPTAEKNREFSSRLAGFAREAHQKINMEYRGVCVYAGGDDVLAFLPVNTCIECARYLRQTFRDLLGRYGTENEPVTLSVGIALGHMMEPLEDLLENGRSAERKAKEATPGRSNQPYHRDRNALAVWVYTRGGVPFGVREQWRDDGDGLDDRILRWAGLFQSGVLPGKLPYDLRGLAEEYKRWSSANTLPDAIQKDAWRVFRRKETRLSEKDSSWVQSRLGQVESALELQALADEMLVATHVGRARRQAEGKPARRGSSGLEKGEQ